MFNKIKLLTQSKFARNVAVVVTGTAGAQAIAMVFSPVITRIYGPETFGAMGTFIAIFEMISPLAALSYPMAMVLPKQDSDAIGLAKISIWIAVITSLITAMVLILFKTPVVEAFNLHAIEPYILLLPITMLFSVLVTISSQWTIRKRLFKLKAKTAILQALIISLMKAGLGLLNPSAIILIGTTSFGYLLQAALIGIGIREKDKEDKPSTHSSFQVTGLLKQYKDFAYYRTPQIFLNSVGQSLPILMLANLFSPAAVGFYVLARTVLFVPSSLIGTSVAEVFYPKFVETIRNGESGKKLLVKASATLAAIGSVPYLVLIAFGPWLFALIFGAEWKEAGEFSRWMSIWLFVVLATRPIIAAIPALSLQGLFLVFEAIAVLIRIFAILIGYLWTGTALGAVMAFSLSNVIIYAALTIIIVRKA
ncbi:lipopolysaccharide biosynthesis protein [Pseudomonas psychrophila]|uniref:lipopolysaccharide biosynthesis protein n=1 Tax=Pseudomonas psychrophila TaxID=122355 RepID=UPI00035711C5|nr:oligosaccharide flippase family protein [Pseudomonas psychrophila]EPJ96490.1 O-antigen and teichoic acid-like export protein [Pseudomonas psychrophila]